MRLGDGHQERVEFVEERRITRQLRLEQASQRLVADVGRHDPVAREHAARVGVRNEDGTTQRVEQDGIGRLGAEAGHGQELRPHRLERRRAQPVEAPAGSPQEEPGQRVEAPRLVTPGPGRPDELSQPRQRQPGEPPGREPARRAEIAYGPHDARPGGMLGQDGAHGDFEAAPCRPPTLGAVAGVERRVESQEAAAQAHQEAR